MGIKDQYRQLVDGALISFLFAFFAYGAMFIFKLLLARYFGASNLGMYTLAETILKIASLFAGLGLAAGIQRYLPMYKYSEQREALKGYLSFIFRATIISSIFISTLVFAFAENISTFFGYPETFKICLQIISFAIPLRVLGESFRHIFVANKQVFYNQVGQNLVEKIVLIVGIGLILLLKLSIIYMILLFVLSILASFLVELIMYLKKACLSLSCVSAKYSYKEWITFSLPLLFTGIFMFVISWTDNIVIGKIMDPSALGIYSVAFGLGCFLSFFKSSIATLFTPLISENHSQDNHLDTELLFKKASAWIFGATLPLFLILVVYSKEILGLLYGKAFVSGSTSLIIVATGFLLCTTTGLTAPVLMMHKKTKKLFYINISVSIFNVILNLILIPKFGIVGAAISTSISLYLKNLITLYYAKKCAKLSFDYTYMVKFTIAGILSIVIAEILVSNNLNAYLGAAISCTIYGLLYVLLLLMFRTFDEDDLDIINNIEKKMNIKIPFVKKIISFFY